VKRPTPRGFTSHRLPPRQHPIDTAAKTDMEETAETRRQAWRQGTALVCAIALCVTAIVHAHRRPFDSDTLQIQADAVHSQSAEADATMQLAAERVVSPQWEGHHLAQVDEQVSRVQDDLARRAAPPELSALRMRTLAAATELRARIAQARHHPIASTR
jgi:hypothetical protein